MSLVWGTKWAPHTSKFLPAEEDLLSHVAELLCTPAGTSQGSAYLQSSCKSPQNAKKLCGAALWLLWNDSFASWTCKSQVSMCLAATQPNQISGVSHSTSRLGYSKLLSCVIQWEICHCWAGTELLSLSCKCIQVSTVPPGLLYLLAVWKEQFLTPNSTRSDMQKSTGALALTSSAESISRVFHQLELGKEIPALVWWCFKMGRMLPLEVLISAACTEAARGMHTLLKAEASRNSQKFSKPGGWSGEERKGWGF